jgi:hypothetical protein
VFGGRREVDESVVDFPCCLATLTGHAAERGIGRTVCLCVDKIEDRFRLFVGELAVKKRALGEFAAMREARARGEAGLENAARRDGATVALELDDILASVGVWALEGKNNCSVD